MKKRFDPLRRVIFKGGNSDGASTLMRTHRVEYVERAHAQGLPYQRYKRSFVEVDGDDIREVWDYVGEAECKLP